MRFFGFRSARAAALALAVLLAAASLAAGCASGTPAASPEKPDITVADFPSIDSAGLYIAQLDGLFARQGLTVKIDEIYSGSQATVTGIEKGTDDISSADYVTYLDNEVRGGAHLKIIAGASILQPNELALLAPAQTKIRSVTQLKGGTVSVAAPGDIATLLVDSLLADNDIPAGDVHFKAGVALPAAPALLARDAVQAAPVPEPYVTEGEEQYGLTEVADLDQGGTANFPIQGFAVTQQWAREYPRTLHAFVTALSQGQQIADSDRGAVEKSVQKFLGVAPMTAAVMSLPEFPLAANAPDLQRVLNAMVQFGFLPAKDISFSLASMSG